MEKLLKGVKGVNIGDKLVALSDVINGESIF